MLGSGVMEGHWGVTRGQEAGMLGSVQMRQGDGTWGHLGWGVVGVMGDLSECPGCLLCPLTLPTLHLGFSIEGPSQAKIECDDKGDGSCDVRYWPTEPGEYAVHVICDDEDIRDSPFIAHIQPAPPDCFPDKVWSRLLHTIRDGVSSASSSPQPSRSLLLLHR